MKIALSEMIFFITNCKNELKVDNKKSYNQFRNRVSHKIDFKSIWPRHGHADSAGVNLMFYEIFSCGSV